MVYRFLSIIITRTSKLNCKGQWRTDCWDMSVYYCPIHLLQTEGTEDVSSNRDRHLSGCFTTA